MEHYNIDFQCFAIVIMAIVLLYSLLLYIRRAEGNKRFINFVIILIVATTMDVVTALIIDYCPNFPINLNKFLNSIYFSIATSSSYAFYSYIDYFMKDRKEKTRRLNGRINRLLLFVYILLFVANYFTGFIFTFTETEGYVKGPFYLVVYFTILYYIVNVFILAIMYGKCFTVLQRVSIFCFIIFEMGGSVVQAFFFPKVMLMYAAASLAIIMFSFTLETPDFQKLKETMSQLEKTREEADAANTAKSNFLANMSHEIRTPINGVLGMNAMILKESSEENIKDYARNIESAGRTLLSTINDVLDISKIEAGKLDIVESKYSLPGIITDVYNLVNMRASEKNLELQIDNDTELPKYLFGDETRVRQIITNLLTNAVKYTPSGTVSLKLLMNPVSDDCLDLKIIVKDTGIGISEENLEKIFDAFQRVDEVKNKNIEGSGMGLLITKQLVELMNGTISVESEYGSGSTFTVILPQKIAGTKKMGYFWDCYVSRKDENVVSTRSFTAPTAAILVVDDVPMNIKVVKGLLKSTSIRVDGASSGEEAIHLASATLYDIIFLDHLMPVMDGVETLNRMKEIPDWINEKTPIIALTANALTGAREQYIEMGFDDYLSKPIVEKDLAQILINHLPDDLVNWDGSSTPYLKSLVVVDKGKVLTAEDD